MKKSAILLLLMLIVSCQKETAPKPDNLLDEGKMVNILYDLALLQAINSHNPSTLEENKVDGKTYIYKKYKIDSLTFAQNHRYYASDLKKYEEMQKKVTAKIQLEKAGYGVSKGKKEVMKNKAKKIRANLDSVKPVPTKKILPQQK